jgi:shikimate kinase
VARLLAARLKCSAIELDDEIEKKEGMKITDIFADKGEPYFRAVEKQALQATAVSPARVVSCGGGVVLDPENIRFMEKTGVLVCLDAPAQAIHERTRHHKHRPLLNVADPLAKIRQMLEKRQPYYAQIKNHVDSAHATPEEVAATIVSLLGSK